MNLGDWEMKKMSSISKKDKLEWENNLLSFKIPNGESNNEFLTYASRGESLFPGNSSLGNHYPWVNSSLGNHYPCGIVILKEPLG